MAVTDACACGNLSVAGARRSGRWRPRWRSGGRWGQQRRDRWRQRRRRDACGYAKDTISGIRIDRVEEIQLASGVNVEADAKVGSIAVIRASAGGAASFW